MSAQRALTRRGLFKGSLAALAVAATPRLLRPGAVRAQALEPIVVVGSLEDIQLQSFASSGVFTGLNTSFVLTTPSQAQAFVDALKALVEQQRQQAQLVNTIVVPPAMAPLVQTPPPVPLPVPESYLFGDEQSLFQANLALYGLTEAQQLTALVALQAALAPVEVASGAMMNTGIKLLMSGWAAGLTAAAVSDIAGGLMIVIPAGAMIAIGIGAVVLIVWQVYPAVEQQITVFGQTLFQYEAQLEFLPAPPAPDPHAGLTWDPRYNQWLPPAPSPTAYWDPYWQQWFDDLSWLKIP